jgi:hypothetical protein
MIVRNKVIVCISLALISTIIGYFLGPFVSFSIQKTLSTTLGGISSILFGVLGIWIGLMAPENLKQIYTTSISETRRENWNELEGLYKPVFISLFVFSLSTSFSFIGELLKTIPLLVKITIYFRMFGLSVLMMLLFITFYLIIISIKPGIEMLANSITFITISDNMDSRYPMKKKKKSDT